MSGCVAKYHCTRCKKEYPWSATIAGKRVRCQCGAAVFIPKTRPEPSDRVPSDIDATPRTDAAANADAVAHPGVRPEADAHPAPRASRELSSTPRQSPAPLEAAARPSSRAAPWQAVAEADLTPPVEAMSPDEVTTLEEEPTPDPTGDGMLRFRDDDEPEAERTQAEEDFDWDRSLYEVAPTNERVAEIDPATGRLKPSPAELEAMEVWAVRRRQYEEPDDFDRTEGSPARNLYVPLGLIVVGLAINFWAARHFAESREYAKTSYLKFGMTTVFSLLMVVGAGIGVIRGFGLNFIPTGRALLKLASIPVGVDAALNLLLFLGVLLGLSGGHNAIASVLAAVGAFVGSAVGFVLYYSTLKYLFDLNKGKLFPLAFATWVLRTYVVGLLASSLVQVFK